MATIVSCLAVTTMFSGCDDKEKQPEIKVENEASRSQTVYADQTEGKSGVTIVTSGAWSSTITEGSVKSMKAGTVTWVSINPDHGDAAGTYTIVISLEPNATGIDREATITITCNGETITITVTQTATKANGEPYATPPVVTTAEATDITATSATLGGNITDSGTPAYSVRGFCFATTANPTIDDNWFAIDGTGTGSFMAYLVAMSPNTTYYVRAYATNDNGTVYGNEVNFTTLTESEKEMLVESSTDVDSNTIDMFEYDNQNRLTKSTYFNDGNIYAEKTYSYSGNNMTVVSKELGYPEYDTTEEFVKNGNKITATWKRNGETRVFTINLDNDDFPTTAISTSREGWTDVYTFTIQNGNMMEWTESYTYTEQEPQIYTYKYKFDDKKSPFDNCTTPKWFMFWDNKGHGSLNNVIEEEHYGEKYEYTYEYDSDGYPTKCTFKDVVDGWEEVVLYKYK